MDMLTISDARAGHRYLTPERKPITVRGPSEHTPGWYDVENEQGRTIQVPADYQVTELEPELEAEAEADELPPEPEAPDPWGGTVTGLGRVEIVKQWTRPQCEAALAAIEAGTLDAQATVRRELGRQLEALAKVSEPDPNTTEGRDELLRLRALQSTARRPGLIATIDALLGKVAIERDLPAVAATVKRLSDDDATLPAGFVEAVTAIAAEFGRPLQQIDLYTIDAMTRTVRSARSAAKACTDPTLIMVAWRHVQASTIREILARRVRALTGTEPENGIPTDATPQPPTAGAPEQVAVRDLRTVQLPDGTTDVWACPPGGKARRLGRADDPALAQVVALMRRHQVETAPTSMADLGSLGPWLTAVKAAGFKVSITISSDDDS